MPSVSESQRITAAIAKHHPGKLYKRNRGMLSMSQEDLGEFASSVKKKRKVGERARQHLAKKQETL